MAALARLAGGLSLVALLVTWPGGARADQKDDCKAASERGQVLALSGHLGAARTEFLACARDECPTIIVRDCVAQLARVDENLGSVVVTATDGSGRSVTRVAVSLDGEPLLSILDGRATSIDPGVHRFRFEVSGQPPIERGVVVEEGAKLQRVAVTFPALGVERAREERPAERPGQQFPAARWILGGVGVVALGGFAYFGLRGVSQSSDLRSRPNGDFTDDEVSSLKTKLRVADVCLGVGVVALGIATWLFLTQPPSPAKAREAGR